MDDEAFVPIGAEEFPPEGASDEITLNWGHDYMKVTEACSLYDRTFFKIGRVGRELHSGVGIMNVAIMIQPGNFREALKENPGMQTSGLLSRIDLCYPPVGEFKMPDMVDCTPYQNWNQAISEIIGQRTDGEPMGIYMDNAAQSLWNSYMTKYRNLARQSSGWLGCYYDRVHVKAIRIALQIHRLEGGTGVMNSPTVERGIRIAEHLKSQNERVVKMFSEGAEHSLSPEQQEVMKVLKKHQPATERDLKRYSPMKLGKMENLPMVLREMVDRKLIDRMLDGKTEKYRISMY